MFTPSASCIFPLVPLKTAVMSVEVLMWFFHQAIISLSVMQRREENKELRAAESNSGPSMHMHKLLRFHVQCYCRQYKNCI